MSIKPSPVGIRTHIREMKAYYKQRQIEQTEALNVNRDELLRLRKLIKEDKEIYKDDYNFDLYNYEEFIEEKYIDGTFQRAAKKLVFNKDNNYVPIDILNNVYQYSICLKNIHDILEDMKILDKVNMMTNVDYTKLIRTYYYKVQELIIKDGYGYAFPKKIGWICINRGKVTSKKKILDYKATTKRKQELLAQGKRPYNNKEKEFCELNGIPYDGIDYRVYRTDEYVYEVPLIHSRIINGSKLKFYVADYRHLDVRGKSNEDLIKECNRDLDAILELDVDLKVKLSMCLECNDLLYVKYIRNENQTPSNFRQNNREG